jgi:hypothetical protein
MTVKDKPAHDYKRHGTRTVLKRTARDWTLWIEDHAIWHLDRTAKIGIEIALRPRSIDPITITVHAGRYSLVAVRTR